MASKPIPLEEAAKLLGISPDELTEAHARNEILDVRGTGSVRKFKMEELQRYADDKGLVLQTPAIDDDGMLDLSEDDDSLVLDDADSLLGSSELVLGEESSAKLGAPSEQTGSDVLAGGEESLGESESDTGKMNDGGDDMLLAEDDLFDDGDLSLSNSGDLDLDSDSSLEDSDLVLDDDSSNEISLSAEDSGINLSPTDSGLSLSEESLELSSGSDMALELPEDEDMISLEDSSDSGSSDQLQMDDDFVLTPVEENMDDDSSGSQVIDLESSEIYVDESSSEIFADSESSEGVFAEADAVDPANAPLVAEDAEVFSPEVAAVGADPIATPAGAIAVIPEKPYNIFNILALSFVMVFVVLTGMVCVDVVRNMWLPKPEAVNSTLLDFIIQMVNLTP